ncbi:MAG: low molecular weight phosphotyrosine protein phosphatase [Alphaproteobacteria bacterium]|nr:low molecular weight phosphotyrosine protein phosphatase [Alphaproteobacteria bacterium]
MIKVLFVCLGNICRSPMAQFVFKQIIEDCGLANRFEIDSAGTNYDCDAHNFIHHGTREMLKSMHVPFEEHYSRRIQPKDYDYYDYILAMEEYNIEDILSIVGPDTKNKIHRLLDWSSNPRDIGDPWYTGNFDDSYWDIIEGCQTFLEHLEKQNLL